MRTTGLGYSDGGHTFDGRKNESLKMKFRWKLNEGQEHIDDKESSEA